MVLGPKQSKSAFFGGLSYFVNLRYPPNRPVMVMCIRSSCTCGKVDRLSALALNVRVYSSSYWSSDARVARTINGWLLIAQLLDRGPS